MRCMEMHAKFVLRWVEATYVQCSLGRTLARSYPYVYTLRVGELSFCIAVARHQISRGMEAEEGGVALRA